MKSSLFVLALVMPFVTTSFASETIECLGTRENGWRTHVLLTPVPKSDGEYYVVVSQLASVSTGYMLGHGGLGISNGNNQDLWLYTGFSKNHKGDAPKAGYLTQKNIRVDKLEMSCDYDDTLKYPEELPSKIKCATNGPGVSVLGAEISISKGSRTIQIMVANKVKPSIVTFESGIRLFTSILYVRGSNETGVVAITIGSNNKGKGVATFGYEPYGDGFQVSCELKNK